MTHSSLFTGIEELYDNIVENNLSSASDNRQRFEDAYERVTQKDGEENAET